MKLHHVGYVVKDIEAYASGFPGLTLEKVVDDPVQSAELALYNAGSCYLEFIRPHGPAAFTWGHLERFGPGMHHVCYEGVSASEIETTLRQFRMLKIRGPIPAVLFGREVLFAMTRQKAIVEFLL